MLPYRAGKDLLKESVLKANPYLKLLFKIEGKKNIKAFIDTSSLIKKYVHEKGSDEFDKLLGSITEIIVSPVYLLEIHSALYRLLQEKIISSDECANILTEVKRDFNFFHKIIWNESTQQKAIEIMEAYHLRTLDSIQLASAALSKSHIFITSDKSLGNAAKKELKNVRLI